MLGRRGISSIVHRAPWGSIVAVALRAEEGSLPGMRTPPHNMLPAIRVDGRRRVTCHLAPSTAWGSPTSHVEMVVPPEANDQLHPPSLLVVAPGTLVRPWRWRG
jgi:hypothetical protein